MGKNRGLALIIIVVGVLANNFVYVQDLWFGQSVISLDSVIRKFRVSGGA